MFIFPLHFSLSPHSATHWPVIDPFIPHTIKFKIKHEEFAMGSKIKIYFGDVFLFLVFEHEHHISTEAKLIIIVLFLPLPLPIF